MKGKKSGKMSPGMHPGAGHSSGGKVEMRPHMMKPKEMKKMMGGK